MGRTIEEILESHGYELGEILGSGSFGVCYKVVSIAYNKLFACKIIEIPFFEDFDDQKMRMKIFETEVKTLSLISHINIVQIYDYFNEDDKFMMILEYCSGSLSEYLQEKKHVNPNEIRSYAKQIISALNFCHQQNICHLDIKPANILFDDNKVLKVADFGLAQFAKDGNLTDVFSGSGLYKAPEIIGKQPYDPFKADVWSFGVTLYKMVTGEFPIVANSYPQIVAQLKAGITYPENLFFPDILKVVKSCLVLDPKQRPSFDELMKCIELKHSLSKPSIAKPLMHKQIKAAASQLQTTIIRSRTKCMSTRISSSRLKLCLSPSSEDLQKPNHLSLIKPIPKSVSTFALE